MRSLLTILQVLIGAGWVASASAQQVRRHTLPPGTTVASQLGNRPFYCFREAPSTARGLLVLLPGRGEPARDVFHATSLAQEAARRGFVVVVPELNDRVCLDEASTGFLDALLTQIVRQYPALSRQLVLGGFSAGGQLAFAYAERVRRDSLQRPWRVRAVLGVDPPLDLAGHYQRAQRHLDQHDCPTLQAGDQRIVTELTRELGGSPAQFPAHYGARSAFSRCDSAGGEARWLRTLPVRVYCEPDVAFWQQHYCAALQATDLNAPDAAALVALLRRQGNTQAHYIQTTGKGYVGKHRMPHSWSLVDAPECAEWLQRCLE